MNRPGYATRPSPEAMLSAVAACGRPIVAIKLLACGRFDENRAGDWLSWALG